MIADEPNAFPPADYIVVSAKVVCPKETLSAKVNGIWNEVEHRYPDRHLYEHRQATAHRTDAVLAVHLHHGLLLLHSLVRIWVLLVQLVKLRLEDTHLGATQIALLLCWEDEYLDDDCQEQKDDAHWQTERFEPIEDVKYRPTIDETKYPPAQVNEFVEVGFRAVSRHLAVCLENVEVIGTEIHLQMRSVLACSIERHLQRSLVMLQVTFLVLNLLSRKRSLCHRLTSDKNGAEELILEGNPLESFFGLLAIVLHFTKLLYAFSLSLVGERTVTILEVSAFFLLRNTRFPFDEQVTCARHRQTFHAFASNVHVEHVRFRTKFIADLQLLSFLLSNKDDARVGLLCNVEAKVGKADVLLLER